MMCVMVAIRTCRCDNNNYSTVVMDTLHVGVVMDTLGVVMDTLGVVMDKCWVFNISTQALFIFILTLLILYNCMYL